MNHNRSDIAFIVGLLCSYMHDPREKHKAYIKGTIGRVILSYLKGTGKGILFKSQNGILFFLGGVCIKNQNRYIYI